MFQRFVRATSLSDKEIASLSDVWGRCARALTLNGYNDREEIAFAILDVYLKGVRDPDRIFERILRTYGNKMRAA